MNPRVLHNLKEADVIICGPGDLYTNQLPVLIVPQIKEQLLAATRRKIFILNIANKPHETAGYSLRSFINAVKEHLGVFPFDTIIVNNNQSIPIPQRYHRYSYISVDNELRGEDLQFKIIEEDLVQEDIPIYHNPSRLAGVVVKNI